DVDAALDGQVLVTQFLSAGHVEERVGVTVKPMYLALAHPVTLPAFIGAAKRPLVAKAMRFEDRGDGRDVVGGVLREVAQFGRVDVAPGIFHVIRVVAEPAQPDEVMEKLIGDAGQRVPKQNPENDDLSFATLRLHSFQSFSGSA